MPTPRYLLQDARDLFLPTDPVLASLDLSLPWHVTDAQDPKLRTIATFETREAAELAIAALAVQDDVATDPAWCSTYGHHLWCACPLCVEEQAAPMVVVVLDLDAIAEDWAREMADVEDAYSGDATADRNAPVWVR